MAQAADWTAAEVAWACPWLRVERSGQWYRVAGAAGAVAVPHVGPIGADGTMAVMVRGTRQATGLRTLEFPRGRVDPGEAGEATAVRESVEETGHALAAGFPVHLGTIAPDAGVLATLLPVYSFEVEGLASGAPDEEVDSVELVPWRDVPGMVLESGGCAITLAAWLMADRAGPTLGT